MSKVELESFLKSFTLFFISISILITAIYYSDYTKDTQKLDETIFSEMRICSFDLKCSKYEIDFVLTEDKELYRLYKSKEQLSSYFPIPNASLNSIELSYPIETYALDISVIKSNTLMSLGLVIFVVLVLSVLFSLYTLYPLRNALHLTQEFVKDILHDFNTPLSTLRLNSSMLEKEFGASTKITRIKKSVQTILNLQINLRSYLHNTESQKEQVDLQELVQQRVEVAQMSYENISYTTRLEKKIIFTNRDALTRVLDNLLSNAGKYNKENGTVEVSLSLNAKVLIIKDSGKGIQKPQNIFDRFYKEQDRGIGIGLHIVKKLCNELGIKIRVESEVGVGSTFCLEFK